MNGQETVFEVETELVALKGSFRAGGDCLLSFGKCESVVVRDERPDRGTSARIRMQKEDYQSAAYGKSKCRHGLAFFGCRKVLVQDLAIEQAGGK